MLKKFAFKLLEVRGGLLNHQKLSTFLEQLSTTYVRRLNADEALRFLFDWWVPLKHELGVERRLDTAHETEYSIEPFADDVNEAGLLTHMEIRCGEIWSELCVK